MAPGDYFSCVRTLLSLLTFSVLLSGAAVSRAHAQEEPRFASYVTSRLVVLPGQAVLGAGPARPWLDQFDATLTGALENGGVGSGWAYPRDVIRAARRNPTYAADPLALGAQPLQSDRARAGTNLPEPFGSRTRALLALNDARFAVVPVAARIDTTQSPAMAELRLTIIDVRQSQILWTGIIETRFTGPLSAAADSLALRTAGLFVAR